MRPFLWCWPLQEHHHMISWVVLIGSRGIMDYINTAFKDQLSLLNVVLTFSVSVPFVVVEWWTWKAGVTQSCPWARLHFLLFLLFCEILVFLCEYFCSKAYMTKYCSSIAFEIRSGVFNFCVLFLYMHLLYRYCSLSTILSLRDYVCLSTYMI